MPRVSTWGLHRCLVAAAESIRRTFVEAAARDDQAGALVGQIQPREAQAQGRGVLIDKTRDYDDHHFATADILRVLLRK